MNKINFFGGGGVGGGVGLGGGVRVDVIRELKFLGIFTKKIGDGGGGVGGVRVDVNEELNFLGIFTKKIGWGVGGRGRGGQGGCERRIEVFVKIQKKNLGGGGSG